jgi:hypothetical protein
LSTAVSQLYLFLQVQDVTAAQTELSSQLDTAARAPGQWGGFIDNPLAHVAQVRAIVWHVLGVVFFVVSLMTALLLYWCAVAVALHSTPQCL